MPHLLGQLPVRVSFQDPLPKFSDFTSFSSNRVDEWGVEVGLLGALEWEDSA